MPDLRRSILLLVVSMIASLAVAASASAATSFTNPTPIQFPGSGSSVPAPPYPSEIAVSGLTGAITDVTVTLHRFGHTHPDDVDILLVSPSGTGVVLTSDACGGDDIEDFTWTFSDAAPRQMSTDSSDCGDFAYQPTNHGDADVWVPPAPPGPYGASLASFDNENPNGAWRLYGIDVLGGESGDIEGGWSISIETGPVDMAIPNTSTSGGTSGPAGPYPATRTVSGQTGISSDVNVTIDGIWHQNPDDLDLLLVGPEGQAVVLMSDACGFYGVEAYGWVWDDEAPALMPDGDLTNACGTRFHRPADYDAGETWPAPAPSQPYSATLSAFDGTDPNGTWSLYVNDDSSGATGFFTNRFELQITTVPRPNRPPTAKDDAYNAREDTTLARLAPGVLANDSDPDGDTLTASMVTAPRKGTLTLRADGSLAYKPKLNRTGPDSFVYGTSDGRGGTDTATINIAPVNDAPTITTISPAPGSSTADRTPLIRARVRDAETNLAKSSIKLFVDGTSIPATRFAYDRETDVLSYTPTTTLGLGSHAVKVVATDAEGKSTTKQWGFKVV